METQLRLFAFISKLACWWDLESLIYVDPNCSVIKYSVYHIDGITYSEISSKANIKP